MARKPLLKTRIKKGSALAAAAIAGVTFWEGTKLIAYKDRIGTGQPWTVCMGETRGVKPGDVYTQEQCEAMLAGRLQEFEGRMRACLTNPDKVPDGPYIAALSLSYNIGSAAFCRSSVKMRFNEGDYRAGCDAILLWNKAGGRVVKGLVNRRRHERKVCLDGLDDKTVRPIRWWKRII